MTRILQVGSMLALVFLLSSFASGQTNRRRESPKSNGVFSNEHIATELKQLRQMSAANKSKVRRSLEMLQDALSTAAVSTDLEEVAEGSSAADDAVDAAVSVIPNGVLKGAMVSCKKALGHSYVLRVVSRGGLDPKEPSVAKVLEEIMIRYQLTRIASYERPAKVLDYVNFHISVAKEIASSAGIVVKSK